MRCIKDSTLVKAALALPVAVMLIGGFWRAAAPHVVIVDRAEYYSWVQAWITQGSLDPGGPLHEWDDDRFRPTMINGRLRTPTKVPIGWSLAALPGVAVSHILALAGNRWYDMDLVMDGTSAWTLTWACVSVLGWVITGYLCSYSALRTLTGALPASVSLLFAWLGTSAFAYTWWEPMMAHGLAGALVGIGLWAAVRHALAPRGTAWAVVWGAASGLLIVTRIVDIVLLLPSAVLLLAHSEHGRLAFPSKLSVRHRRALLAAGLGLSAPLALQMWIWHAVYGVWWYRGYTPDETLHWAPVNIGLTLISSNHGVLFWHPIVAVAVVGFWVAALRDHRVTRMLGAASLIAAAILLLIYGSWYMWWLGWSHGARWAADLLPLWALGLAWFFERFVTRANARRIVPGLLALALLSAVLQTAQFNELLPMAGRLVTVPGTHGRVRLPWP